MDDLSFLDKYAQPKPVTTDYDGFIEESASKYGVDPDLIRLQMGTESAFKPKARSPKGASGLMQLMPGTARNLGVKDIYDPKQNIDGGVKYMRQLLDMFGGDVNLALAGYNAGEGAVQKYGNKIPPYKETRNYVKKIAGNYKGTGYHPTSLNFLDKYVDAPSVADAPDSGLSFLDKYVDNQDTGTTYGMTDIKGGATTSPTFPTQQPVSTTPVPESPDALQAQINSTFDANSPKAMTLLTKDNPANNYFLNTAEAKRLTRVDTPNGIVLVNTKKLGIKPSQAAEYVKKNGFAKDSGFVIDMGNNTGDGQPAVVAVDPNTGKEVFAAVTPTPESAQIQAQKNAAMFPGTLQVPTNTDEVTAKRNDDALEQEYLAFAKALNLDPKDPNTVKEFNLGQELNNAGVKSLVGQYNQGIDEQNLQIGMDNAGRRSLVDQYNAGHKGQTVRRPTSQLKAGQTANTAQTPTTDAEYQAHVDDATKYGTPILTREQFDKTANSTGSVGLSLNPNDFVTNGQKLTDFQIATREKGGEGYVPPKEVGKPNDDLKATAYIFRPDRNLSERDAAKAALEAAARANGVSGFSFAQYEQSRQGKSLFPTGYQPGDQIQVDYQALKDGGADVDIRTEQVQNRDKMQPTANNAPFVGQVTNSKGERFASSDEIPTFGDFVDQILGDRNQDNTLTEERKKAIANRQVSDEDKELDKALSTYFKPQVGGGVGEEVVKGLGLKATEYLSALAAGASDLVNKVPGMDVGSALIQAVTGKNPSDYLGKFSNHVKEVNALSTSTNKVYKIAREVGEVAGALPAYVVVGMATRNPVLTFAATDALIAKGQGGSTQDVVKAGLKGAALGVAFGGFSRFGKGAADAILGEGALPSIIGKDVARKTVEETAMRRIQAALNIIERDTTMAGEAKAAQAMVDRELAKAGMTMEEVMNGGKAVPANLREKVLDILENASGRAIARKIIETGVPIGVASGTGYGMVKIEGGSDEDALKNALLFGAMQALSSVFHKEPNEKFTPEEMRKADGATVRAPDDKGKPRDLMITEEAGKLRVTDVTGKVPDGTVQSVVLPKDDFIPKITEEDVADATKPETKAGEKPVKPTKVTLEPVEDIAKSDKVEAVVEVKEGVRKTVDEAVGDWKKKTPEQLASDILDASPSRQDAIAKVKKGIETNDSLLSDSAGKGITDAVVNGLPAMERGDKLRAVQKILEATPTQPTTPSPVRERAKAKAAEKFGVKGKVVDEAKISDEERNARIEARFHKDRRDWIDKERETNPTFAPDSSSAKELLSPAEQKETVEYEALRHKSVAKNPDDGYRDYKMTRQEKSRLVELEKKYRHIYFTPETVKRLELTDQFEQLVDNSGDKPVFKPNVTEQQKKDFADKILAQNEANGGNFVKQPVLDLIKPLAQPKAEAASAAILRERAQTDANKTGKPFVLFETIEQESTRQPKSFDEKVPKKEVRKLSYDSEAGAIKDFSASKGFRIVERFTPKAEAVKEPRSDARTRLAELAGKSDTLQQFYQRISEDGWFDLTQDEIRGTLGIDEKTSPMKARVLAKKFYTSEGQAYRKNATKAQRQAKIDANVESVIAQAERANAEMTAQASKAYPDSRNEKATNLEAAKAKVEGRKADAVARRDGASDRVTNLEAFKTRHQLQLDITDATTFADVQQAVRERRDEIEQEFADKERALSAEKRLLQRSRQRNKVEKLEAIENQWERDKQEKRKLISEMSAESVTLQPLLETPAETNDRTTRIKAATAKRETDAAQQKEQQDRDLWFQIRVRYGGYENAVAKANELIAKAERSVNVAKTEASKNERIRQLNQRRAELETVERLNQKYGESKAPALRSIPDPLTGIITSKGVDYERAKDVAGRIERGEAKIERLDADGERGRIAGGRRAIEASLILAANERASEGSGSRTRPVERQERALEEYAKREGIWIAPRESGLALIGKGVEAKVYGVAGGKSVQKVIDYKQIDKHATPLDFIDNRIAAFNQMFPDTAYELVGFTRTKDGFRFVINQPFIQDTVYTTAPERQAFMKKKGFEMVDRYGEQFANRFYHVSDLHEKNALIKPDGTILVIDAVTKAKPISEFAVVPAKDEALRSVAVPQSQIDAVKEVRNADGKLLAPNGKVSNLNERQWKEVRTPNFINYFGDWINDPENASKVVDENGEPLVVYHGTPTGGFDTFEQKGRRDPGWMGKAFYFTENKSVGETFKAKSDDIKGVTKRRLYQTYLSASKPLKIQDLPTLSENEVKNALNAMRVANGREPLSQAKWLAVWFDLQHPVLADNDIKLARHWQTFLELPKLAQLLGYDSLYGDMEGGTWAVFEPNQIKSATSNNGNFDPNDPSILRSIAQTPFYSRVESVIRDKMPNKATSAQVTALLAKNSVKELDPEFQALKVWLDDQGSVSKDDVLAFVAANKNVVGEVVKGDIPAPADGDIEAWWNDEGGANEEKPFNELTPQEWADAQRRYEDEVEQWSEDQLDFGVKFAQWQLPGESENYREEFLTAPQSVTNADVPNFSDWLDNLEDKPATRHEAAYQYQREFGIDKNWKDGHADYDDIVNPIARIRYNDRTTTDGDKMLFAEEFQQPGKGNFEKMPKVYQKYGEQMAIRKMLYRAVEGGYDYFGFTTGQQQADRYSLAKQVESINVEVPTETDGEVRFVTITPKSGDKIYLETENGKVRESEEAPAEMIGKPLEDVVGKPMAEKILEVPIEDGWAEFSGEDLKVGGIGLAQRYDRKHVDYINKLMKPYGVSVEAKDIASPTHNARTGDNPTPALFEIDGQSISNPFRDEMDQRNVDPMTYWAERGIDKATIQKALETVKGNDFQTIHAVRISPEFRKAVEASIREHGGAFPLFKVAEPGDIAEIEALIKGNFRKVFTGGLSATIEGDELGKNQLHLDDTNTIAFVHQMLDVVENKTDEPSHIVVAEGIYLNPRQVNDMRDAILGTIDAATDKNIDTADAEKFLKTFNKAVDTKHGDMRVVAFDGRALGHETAHQQSERGASDKNLAVRRSGLRDLVKGTDTISRDFQTAGKRWAKIQGVNSDLSKLSDWELGRMGEEVAVYIADGRHTDLGLTYAKGIKLGVELQLRYAEARIAENPDLTVREALATFEGTILQPFSEQVYEREQPSKSDQSDVESKGTGRENDQGNNPRNTQSDGDGVSQEPASETFTPAGEEKLSKTPSTLNKAGIPVQQRLYASTSNPERQAFADERMDEGIDAAIKWTKDQLDTKNNNAGATGVVGINVLNQLGKEGRIDELNKFADDLLPAFTDAAQMVQAVTIVSMFSPKTAGAYVTKVAKQNGQDVTPEQIEKALDIAQRMSEVVQTDGLIESALTEATAENEQLKKDIADLESALGIAEGKVKEFKGKLSGQGRTIAALRREIEGKTTEKKPRLGTEVRKHLKELNGRKQEILDAMRARYGDNPILQMVAPGGEALRSVAESTIDQTDIDWATIYLGDNLGKLTPAQVKDAINVATNGKLTPEQINEIHAEAAEALQTERSAMDADTKAANKIRQSHYREARNFRNSKLTDFEKSLNKGTDKYTQTLIREGIEQGYTDDVIWFALARKHKPNVNDALAALREEFPDLNNIDRRKLLRDAELLTQATKSRVKSDLINKQNEFSLNDEDINLIKEERRVNTHEKQKVVREADRFYQGMVKGAGEIILDTIVNMRRANLLTAVKTHFVNIGGNVGFAVGEEIARVPSTWVDLAASIFTGERTTTLSPKAIGNGLKALVAQDETLKNSKWETPEGKERGMTAARHVLQYGGAIADMERLQHSESILSAKFENRPARWIDNYINGVFKTLGAEDAFFKVYAFRRHIEEQARAIALTERRKDKDVDVKQRTAELIKNPTNVMQVQADRYAHFMTFQNDNALSGFIASIKRGRPGLKAGVETIMPYDRTPTNIVMRVMEYTPAGMVIAPIRWKGAQKSFDRNKPSGMKFRNELTGAVKADLAQSEDFNNLPETERRKIVEATLRKVFTREQQETFAKTIGRSSLGTGLFSLGFVMAAAGLMAGAMSFDDDDKTESTEAEKRKKAGIENGSIQTPWGRIVLPKSPPTAIMTAGATFYEQMALSKKSPLIAAMGAGVEAFSDMASELPLINSTYSVLRSLGKGKFGEFTGNIASGFVPASAMLRSLSDLTDDKDRTGSGYKKGEKIKSPEQYLNYQGRGLRNSLIKGIPWLRQYADESTSGVSDIERGGLGRRIVRIIDPFNTRTEVDRQPGSVKEMIEGVVTYAKAIGSDPITAFNIIYKGERIRRVDNGAIIVERMDFEDSGKVRKDRNASKGERLDHKMPLQLGGLNDEDNLELRPINDWARFTPIENALGRALRSEKITKDEAQKLMRQYKDGEITEADITSFKNGAVTITAGDAKPRTDLDPKNPIGNQSAVQKLKELGSVDNLLQNNSVRYWSTDDWVAVMGTDMSEADRQKAATALRKKADNAQKAKSLTSEELERVKSVLPDYVPKQPRKLADLSYAKDGGRDFDPEYTDNRNKWKGMRQSENVIDRREDAPLTQFIRDLNGDLDSLQRASFTGGTLAERREARKEIQSQITETRWVLKNKTADRPQARRVLKALLDVRSRVN